MQKLQNYIGDKIIAPVSGLYMDNYNPATGEIPSDFAVYCLGVDRNGRASEPLESGLRFDHRAKQVTGALRCP